MVINIRHIGDARKGKRWSKRVDQVDEGQKNGYAFKGEFLQEGENQLSEGNVVLQVGYEGSWKNGYLVALVSRVQDGELNAVHANTIAYRENFFTLRDTVRDALNQKTNPLADFTDQQLLDELKNRGYNL